MTGGQILVFWCCIAGFVVIFLAELWRWRNGHTPVQRSDNARLRAELQRHKGEL